MRSLSQALKSIRRSPYQALAALLILFVTFFIGYTLTLFLLGSQKVLEYFETRPQVTAFFNQEVSQEQLDVHANTLRQESFVKNVEIITQDEALEIYRNQTSDDPLLQELVTADILPPSLEVSTYAIDDLVKVAQVLQGLQGVDEVVYREDVVNSLRYWTHNLRKIGLGILGLFVTTSLIVILMITSMRISSKKNEIRVQRLVGATQWYVVRPFVIEGMFYGILGSSLAWVATYVALLYASPLIESFIPEVSLVPISFLFMAALWGVGSIIGATLGVIASIWSARRLLAI